MITAQQATLSLLLSAALTAAAQTSAPPVKDDLFAGTEKFAQGASSVTQIDMDPDSLGKVQGKDGLQARRTVLSVVHTYEYDKPGMYKIEDVEAFRKKLEGSDWHCSVHIREMKTGESTDICSKRRTDELTEEAIITVEPKSLTFIHTVRRGGGSWHGAGEASFPLEMRTLGPEMRGEMAVMQAEMKAEMAAMRPQMQGFALEMKNFKAPDPKEMLRLQEQMKNFKAPDPKQMQQLREDLNGLDLQTPSAPAPPQQP